MISGNQPAQISKLWFTTLTELMVALAAIWSGHIPLGGANGIMPQT
jgi:hypothetical protein